ncbi:N-acetyltransferase [Staphylococcus schweitzeri]|uniref:N-acetyltransferase n=1 Tax=Staphylococcus schweitzeri TaxID=1654388 RepID=A0A2K4AIX3_9STAP|nr:N-acetyltransferase [Staphylococcus schweitzeri]MBE2127456.1 N-acetyltransferase [Staphylococcus schweitzeri]PNZ50061.1 N-acetyltransferase [Staphylococcus schweitzeri]CDR53013.1 Acetyltransferase (GNAT) family protein [Staphylococcus schweitzeri]VEE65028.1 Predicted acetyltransferase [Staphylococcus schweitzeri]
MQIYLSTLTELDYDKSLNSIEESFDINPETSWQARGKVKNLRKSPYYNFELEVIAKNENNDVVGHILLIEIEINSKDKTYYALAIASLSVKPDLRNQKLGRSLVQAVEERAKAQEYSTIVVDHCLDYFEKLGYEDASAQDIEAVEGNAPLLVKFLWDNLTDAPHGIVKFPEHFY